MTATIRKRSRMESAITDQTCTPRLIADRLPHRHIDPCSNSRSIIRADWAYSLEKGLDGLKLPWRGDGFANWPFSCPLPFANKAQHEMIIGNCTDLIVLCKLDPSTEWWATITKPVFDCLDLWMFNELRVEYDEHPDVIEKRRIERVEKARRDGVAPEKIAKITGESTNNFVSVLIHHHKKLRQTLHQFEDVATRWVQAWA